jgi:hypothetical protein
MVLGVKASMVKRNSPDCFGLRGISLNLSMG